MPCLKRASRSDGRMRNASPHGPRHPRSVLKGEFPAPSTGPQAQATMNNAARSSGNVNDLGKTS